MCGWAAGGATDGAKTGANEPHSNCHEQANVDQRQHQSDFDNPYHIMAVLPLLNAFIVCFDVHGFGDAIANRRASL